MEKIKEFLVRENIPFSENEPLQKHSTFRIGRNAKICVFPKTEKQLSDTVRFFKQSGEEFLVLGRGSNVLFPDRDIEYPLIFTENVSDIVFDTENENRMICGGGVLLSKAVNEAMKKNLGGMEFAGGIPGSVGGAVVMNAGAYGKNISDVLLWTEYSDKNGEIKKISNAEHLFGYRKSVFTRDDTVLRSCFLLEEKPAEKIREELSVLSRKRRESQPLEMPSAGSVFKRPEGHYVGAMVEECGLKGFCVGGACVSEKHAGFIVNNGGASASDVKTLVKIIQERVYDKFGVTLEREIRYID